MHSSPKNKVNFQDAVSFVQQVEHAIISHECFLIKAYGFIQSKLDVIKWKRTGDHLAFLLVEQSHANFDGISL